MKTDNFINKLSYSTPRNQPIVPINYCVILGLIILVITKATLSWDTLSHPSFFMEDSLLFRYYYGHFRPLIDIFRSHIGQCYLVSLIDSIAWISSWVDVRFQPYLYTIVGFSISSITATIFFFSKHLSQQSTKLYGPVILGLIGINHIFYYATLIYSMYTCVLILLLLLFIDYPQKAVTRILFTLLFIVLPWAGPFSVLFLPAGIIYLLIFREKYIPILFGLISTGIYLSFVTQGTIRIENIKQSWVVAAYFNDLLAKVLLYGIFDKVSSIVWVLVLAGLSVIFYVLRKDYEYLKISFVFFSLIGGSLAMFFLSSKFPLYQVSKECHRLVSEFFWTLFIIVSLDRLIRLSPKRKLPLTSLCCTALICLATTINLKYKNRNWFEPFPEVIPFVNTVYYFEQADLVRQKLYVNLLLINRKYPLFSIKARVGYRDSDGKRFDETTIKNNATITSFIEPYITLK